MVAGRFLWGRWLREERKFFFFFNYPLIVVFIVVVDVVVNYGSCKFVWDWCLM